MHGLNAEALAFMYIGLEWAIRFGMLFVVPFRRTPEAARSWLLLVMFLPVPAALLYLVIGRARFPRWRRKRFARLSHLMGRVLKGFSADQAWDFQTLSESVRDAAKLVQKLGYFPTATGNDIKLLSDYQTVLDQMVADIEGARRHVHILVYIFADDEVGHRVTQALIRAAGRGVMCRVLADAVGSHWSSRNLLRKLRKGGVAAHLILPFGWRRLARADLRNHRKIVVVDGEVGYIGSQNIIGCESAEGLHNRELVARATGPVVREMQAIFVGDWFLETEEFLEEPDLFVSDLKPGVSIAQVLPSGPDYSDAGLERLLVALIHRAHSKVVIATPYFVPSEPLLHALATAVQRGVSVEVLLSRRTDNRLVRLAQGSYYADLLQAGVILRHYTENFLHAKYVLVDEDVGLIGSSNLDIRSFLLNAEVTLVVYSQGFVAELARLHRIYEVESEKLDPSIWQARPQTIKIGENLARLVSPLL